MAYKAEILLSVEDIRDITRYAHYIPITRGFHHEFLRKRFPGWSWNSFLPRFHGAKIVKHHDQHGDEFQCQRLVMGLCLRADIVAVRVTRRGDRIYLKVFTDLN